VTYRWHALTFPIPAGFRDQTVVVMTHESGVSLSVSADTVGDVDAYVDDTVIELTARLKNFRLLERGRHAIGATSCTVIALQAKGADGRMLRQHQAFFATSDKIVIITATGNESQSTAAKAALDELLMGLQVVT
jgi:hypothetical protein